MNSPLELFLQINRAARACVPKFIRGSRLGRRYGMFLHSLVRRHSNRRQYFATFFMRNRPELELIRRLTAGRPQGSTVRIAILGCSVGAEIYSVLWAIRSSRPDLRVEVSAVDYAKEVLEIAARAVYTSETSGFVGESIFERLTDNEMREMFDWDGGAATVKPWLREGISWHLGDAGDAELIRSLGKHDIVMASNFLCHMSPPDAERCLRNIAHLVSDDGHIFVLGVDLDVRLKVAQSLHWAPIPDLLKEIHDGDPSVRGDWPWKWWGLEPLAEESNDWQMRYAVGYGIRGGSYGRSWAPSEISACRMPVRGSCAARSTF